MQDRMTHFDCSSQTPVLCFCGLCCGCKCIMETEQGSVWFLSKERKKYSFLKGSQILRRPGTMQPRVSKKRSYSPVQWITENCSVINMILFPWAHN